MSKEILTRCFFYNFYVTITYTRKKQNFKDYNIFPIKKTQQYISNFNVKNDRYCCRNN